MKEKVILSPTGHTCVKVSSIGAMRLVAANGHYIVRIFNCDLDPNNHLDINFGINDKEALMWIQECAKIVEDTEIPSCILKRKRFLRPNDEKEVS